MKAARADIKHINGLCDDLKNEIDALGERLLSEIQNGIDLQNEVDRLTEELDKEAG